MRLLWPQCSACSWEGEGAKGHGSGGGGGTLAVTPLRGLSVEWAEMREPSEQCPPAAAFALVTASGPAWPSAPLPPHPPCMSQTPSLRAVCKQLLLPPSLLTPLGPRAAAMGTAEESSMLRATLGAQGGWAEQWCRGGSRPPLSSDVHPRTPDSCLSGQTLLPVPWRSSTPRCPP